MAVWLVQTVLAIYLVPAFVVALAIGGVGLLLVGLVQFFEGVYRRTDRS